MDVAVHVEDMDLVPMPIREAENEKTSKFAEET